MRFLTSALTAVSVAFAAVAEASCENTPSSHDCRSSSIQADLGPRLSPNATIEVLRCNNSMLFEELTYRYSTVHPQLTAFVSVGEGEDVGEIVRMAILYIGPCP